MDTMPGFGGFGGGYDDEDDDVTEYGVPSMPDEQTCPRNKPIEQPYCGEPRCAIHKRDGARDKLFGRDATSDMVRRLKQLGRTSFPDRPRRRWPAPYRDPDVRALNKRKDREAQARERQKLAPIPKPEPVFVEPVVARARIPDVHEEV